MHKPFEWVTIVTILSLVVFIATAIRVGGARAKHGVEAPATTGNEIFERHFRVQMNTLEQLVIYLPSLWLFTIYWGQTVATAAGLIWIAGRVLYMTSYVADPKKRSIGFMLTFLPTLFLMIGALAGAIRAMMATGGV